MSMGSLSLIQRTLGVMRENSIAHLLSIGTIAISFFLFAAFLLLPLNLATMLQTWERKVQIILYLKDDVGELRGRQLASEVKQQEGVRGVRYISPREAKAAFERDLSGYGGILKGVAEEVFPASLEIELDERHRTPERIKGLASRLGAFPEVEEVEYGGIWLERLSLFLYTLRWGGWIVGGVLVAIVMSVTANTVRLTLYQKRGEIEILRLVGATDAFVKLPFYLAGGLQGLMGAGVSLLLLFFLYRLFIIKVAPYVSLYFGELHLSFLPLSMVGWILGIGFAAGLFGSLLSLKRVTGM